MDAPVNDAARRRGRGLTVGLLRWPTGLAAMVAQTTSRTAARRHDFGIGSSVLANRWICAMRSGLCDKRSGPGSVRVARPWWKVQGSQTVNALTELDRRKVFKALVRVRCSALLMTLNLLFSMIPITGSVHEEAECRLSADLSAGCSPSRR